MYINIQPYRDDNFLEIFDLVADNGDVYFHIEQYETKKPNYCKKSM